MEFKTDLKAQHNIIEDGLKLFEILHGFKARLFVPPNGPINNELEKTAADNEIKYMSSPKIQTEVFGDGKTQKHIRYIGKQNQYRQIYITRNAFFEPSASKKDSVRSCLNEIELAFKFNKPAVISSHRVNYIGVHDQANRTNSHKQLKELLGKITQKWPEVEFMTSSELGQTIKESKHA